MNWSLLFTRILVSVLILVVVFFVFKRVWTKKLDIKKLFTFVSEKIPVKEGNSVNPQHLITSILISVLIFVVVFFVFKRVWTKEVDIEKFFTIVSEKIPIKEGVSVNPQFLNVTHGEWAQTRYFEVKNQDTKNTAYSIWVKIWPEVGTLRFKETEILTKGEDNFMPVNLESIYTNFDIIKIYAFDVDKKPCIYLLVYRLESNDSLLFKVRQKSKGALNLNIKVLAVSSKPAQILTQTNKIALYITTPEPMTPVGMFMLPSNYKK